MKTDHKDEGPRPRVLVVDDDDFVLKAIGNQLRRTGSYRVEQTSNPLEAITLLQGRPFEIILCDQLMPNLSGIDLLSLARQNRPELATIMLTGCGDIAVAAEVVNRHLADFFITKPWEQQHLLELVAEAARLNRKRHQAHSQPANAGLPHRQAVAAVHALARAVDARDGYTHSHSEKVAALALVLGKHLGLEARDLERLHTGGLLHDVGKIGVPDGVLLKQGPLEDHELAIIRRHPQVGLSIVEPVGLEPEVAAIVVQHHENFDGSGYPAGRAGENISPLARIVRVVDAFEAMTADRVYRRARDEAWIRGELERHRGSQFEPRAATAFLELYDRGLPRLPEVV